MNNIIKRVWNQNRLVNIEDLTGMVFQAEADGHTFEISGIDDTGAAVALSGSVAGVFRRPDNADIALTGAASGGVVSVTLSEDCYAVPGRFGLTIFVTSNSQKVAVYACVGTVAVSSTGNVAGDTPASVEDLIDDINAAIADLNSAIGQIPASYANVMAAIAPAYSSSALYAVGSYAWYDGSLYRCITAITTAESWTSAHWTAAAIGKDVGSLSGAVRDNLGGYSNVIYPSWEQGNIGLQDYQLTYSEATTTCRFAEGESIILTKGAKIKVTDPVYRFTYYYSSTDGKWYGQGGNTEYEQPTNERRIAITVRRTDWHVITADEAANAITITLPNTQYYRNNESFYKTFSVRDSLLLSGLFFSSGNGLAAGSNGAKVSGFVPVRSGQKIYYNLSAGSSTGRYVICLYDSRYGFVSGVEGIGANSITVQNDGYVRFCCINDYDGMYAYFDYEIPDKIRTEIESINDTLVSDFVGTTYMREGESRIVSELKEKSDLGNIVVIGFSTDQHIWTEVQKGAVRRGLQVMSRLTRKYPFDFICLGGDACEPGSQADTLNEILDNCIEVQEPLYDAWCPVVPITGNHDAAQNNANMTGAMLFNAHFKRIANSGFLKGWDNTHTNGYWDSEAHQIRFIFFDDTTRADYTQTQRNNILSSMVSGTPSGFKIVIFSHHPLSQSLSDSHWQNPVWADDILVPYAGRIICCICGHSHADISETQNGILYIATTMAMLGTDQDGNTRTAGVEGETAFDTFVIDQTNKKIYAFRYGYGSNRDWTYTVT